MNDLAIFILGCLITLVTVAAVDAWVAQLLENGPLALRAQKALMAAWETHDLASSIAAGIDSFAAAFEQDEPARMMAPYLKGKPGRG